MMSSTRTTNHSRPKFSQYKNQSMNQLTSVQIMGALACNPSKPGVAYLYPRFSDVFKEYRKELRTVMG